jgi:hypothetical protein
MASCSLADIYSSLGGGGRHDRHVRRQHSLFLQNVCNYIAGKKYGQPWSPLHSTGRVLLALRHPVCISLHRHTIGEEIWSAMVTLAFHKSCVTCSETPSLHFSSSTHDPEWAHFTTYRFTHSQLVLKVGSSIHLPDLTAHTKHSYKNRPLEF